MVPGIKFKAVEESPPVLIACGTKSTTRNHFISSTADGTNAVIFKLIRCFVLIEFFYRPTGVVGRVAVENSPIDWRLEVP